MRSVPVALKTHLAGRVRTTATCIRALRRDGVELGFTSHVYPLVIDGLTYSAAAGFTPTSVESSGSFAVDNLELAGILNSPSITEIDLRAGRWDDARIEMFQVNYEDLTQGRRWKRVGKLGDVKAGRIAFVAELRGLLQAYSQRFLRLYGPGCDADVFDARCGLDPAPFTFTGAVLAATDRRVFTISGAAAAQVDDYFTGGKLTWTAGANDDLVMEVKQWDLDTVTMLLQLPMPFDIAPGDTFSVYRGCDKSFETCHGTFNNRLRFRGFHKVRGLDSLTSGEV